MRIVITGANGFVGSRLMKRFDAIGLDYSEGNLVNTPLPDADIVYHLAAHASVEQSWKRPVDYMDNLRTTVRLVHAYPDAKIILASSCVNMNPESSPYAFSKRIAADYLKLYHKNYVNLIFPNIYGGSVRSVVDIYKNAEEIKVFGDGLQVRDYVHVDDIVQALVLAKDWDMGEYSLGSGVGTTVLDLATATGKPITMAPARNEQREAVIPNTSPNWKPTISVIDYICQN